MSDEPTSAAAELRISLLIARWGQVLLGRPGGSEVDSEWTLPSGRLAEGESFAAAARRIAESSLGLPLTLVNFQRLSLTPDSSGAAPSVTLGLYAEVETRGQARDASWLFFPVNSLPPRLTLDAQAALRTFLGGAPIVDLDGQALELGYGKQLPRPAGKESLASLLSQPEAAPDVKTQPTSQWSALFKSALLLSGGWGWLTGVAVALDVMGVFRGHSYEAQKKLQIALNGGAALLILWLGLRQGFRLSAAPTRWRGVFRALGSVALGLMFFFGLVLLAQLNPHKHDDLHIAFWVWFLSLLTTALSLRLLRPRQEPRPGGALRKLVWLSLTFASLVTVFPPLKDALFPRASDSDHTADAPPPRDD